MILLVTVKEIHECTISGGHGPTTRIWVLMNARKPSFASSRYVLYLESTLVVLVLIIHRLHPRIRETLTHPLKEIHLIFHVELVQTTATDPLLSHVEPPATVDSDRENGDITGEMTVPITRTLQEYERDAQRRKPSRQKRSEVKKLN